MNTYKMIIALSGDALNMTDRADGLKLYTIKANDFRTAETKAARIFDRTLGEGTWAWDVKPMRVGH